MPPVLQDAIGQLQRVGQKLWTSVKERALVLARLQQRGAAGGASDELMGLFEASWAATQRVPPPPPALPQAAPPPPPAPARPSPAPPLRAAVPAPTLAPGGAGKKRKNGCCGRLSDGAVGGACGARSHAGCRYKGVCCDADALTSLTDKFWRTKEEVSEIQRAVKRARGPAVPVGELQRVFERFKVPTQRSG